MQLIKLSILSIYSELAFAMKHDGEK